MGKGNSKNGSSDIPPTASKDIIVLGAIRHGIMKFDRIQRMTNLSPEELNTILEDLESRGYISVKVKKGWLGTKVEMHPTKEGIDRVDDSVREMQAKWGQMQQVYKSGDKGKMRQYLDDNRSILPMMLFFGVVDMMMFSMMFSMIGMPMSSYVPAESMPEGADGGGADGGGADGGDGGGAGDMGDGGGFDFDVGF